MATTIRHGLDVAGAAERAFTVFTDELGRWWPPEYTWSGPDALAGIGMERGAGGLCYEHGPHGFRCDWGRVLVWDPPRRLVFLWQVGPHREPVPDPERAGEVEIRFHAEGPARTRVEVEHREFDRYGPEGAEYAVALDAPEGWPYLLKRFADAVP